MPAVSTLASVWSPANASTGTPAQDVIPPPNGPKWAPMTFERPHQLAGELYAGHSSHSSHASHASHYSGSGGGYTAPSYSAPSYSAPPYTPSAPSFTSPTPAPAPTPSPSTTIIPATPYNLLTSPGDPSASPTVKGKRPVKPELIVMRVQLELLSRSLYSGKVDGQLSPELRKSIKAFQVLQDIPETGSLDDATLSKLGIVY
ncbi:His-Xaa-Ser repeat protein HxsA [Faunimonas pinastri]|nr:His-Xaa-Ser repeat protein HxsA [Faunimonas pinastri]